MTRERPTCRECACTKVCKYFENENEKNLDEVCPLCNWEKYFVPKREWISVEESLPEESGIYLVFSNLGNRLILDYSARHKLFNSFDSYSTEQAKGFAIAVTHWMPLPQPPETKGETE